MQPRQRSVSNGGLAAVHDGFVSVRMFPASCWRSLVTSTQAVSYHFINETFFISYLVRH